MVDTPTKGRGYAWKGRDNSKHHQKGAGQCRDMRAEGRGYEGTRPLRGGATAQPAACRGAGSELAAPKKGAGPKGGACQNQAGKGRGYDGYAPMGAGLRGGRGNGHKEAALQHQAERGRGLSRPRPQKGRD